MKALLKASSILIVLFVLSGCVSTPERNQSSELEGNSTVAQNVWRLKGRVGLKTSRKSGSFNINWAQEGDHFDIRLSSTLGLSVAHIEGDSQRASIDIPKQGRFEAKSAASLLQEHTGLVIPVESLQFWVRGNPAPEIYFEKQQAGFKQSGWGIEYLEYDGELPRRIKLTRGEIRILLLVHRWQS